MKYVENIIKGDSRDPQQWDNLLGVPLLGVHENPIDIKDVTPLSLEASQVSVVGESNLPGVPTVALQCEDRSIQESIVKSF